MISLRSGVKLGLMKKLLNKLDFNKFIELIKNDKFEYAIGPKGFPEISIALKDSYFKYKKKNQSVFDFRHKFFKDSDIDGLFQETSKIRKDFLKLDKSIKYTTITQSLSDPSADSMVFSELGYLSSNKTKYSFLISAYDYNLNFTLTVFKVFENLKKQDFNNLHETKDCHYYTENCYYYMFNNKWNWNLNKIKKDLIKNFLPKKHGRIHLCLCVEKKINNRKWNPYSLGKNEDYKYIS